MTNEEFLKQSTESLHANLAQLVEKVDQLTDTVRSHERRWERLRRVLTAALRAGLEDDDSPK